MKLKKKNKRIKIRIKIINQTIGTRKKRIIIIIIIVLFCCMLITNLSRNIYKKNIDNIENPLKKTKKIVSVTNTYILIYNNNRIYGTSIKYSGVE
jgi:hypothetical protein